MYPCKIIIISKVLIVVLILIFAIVLSACKNDEIRVITEPDQEVAKLLFEKRAVMIADYGHRNPAPYYSLLKILNKWLEQVILKKGDYAISLILEHNSVFISKIKNFLNTGDIDTVYNATYSFGTLEEIEFYNNLRKFQEKIGNIKNKRIGFELNGFEQVHNENFFKLSQKEGDLWFVKERDSITANGIINYMNSNPDNCILIFYGGAHLQNGYLEKQTPTLTYSESLGYYLAHYLKKEFGEDEILTINQAIVDSNKFFFTPLEKYAHTSILLESRFIPGGSRWERFEPENFDMYILRNEVFVQHPHRNNFMFSRRCIEKAIKRLDELKNIEVGYDAKREYDEIMEKLFIITGEKFKNKDELKSWFEKKYFVGLKRFEQRELPEQIFKYYYSNIGNRRGQKVLNEFGFGQGVYGKSIDTLEYKKWEKEGIQFWAYHNAESVYWLGYPDEKAYAKKILIKYSGQDFNEPEQYMQWVRKTEWMADY